LAASPASNTHDKIEPDVVVKQRTLFRCLAAFIRSSLGAEMSMPNRDLIRASEIADWCFCRRSWYLTARGVGPSLVQIEKRHAGVNYHQQHARSVDQARSVMNGATRALLVAVVLAAAYWFWAYAR
jgi:hypothetical protein